MEKKFKPSFINPDEAAQWLGITSEEMMHHIEDGSLHFPYRGEDGKVITGQQIFLSEAEEAGLLGSDEDFDNLFGKGTEESDI